MFTRLILVSGMVLATAGIAFAGELTLYSSRTVWNAAKAGANVDLAFSNMTFETFAGSYSDATGILDASTGVRFVGLQSNGTTYDLTASFGFSGSQIVTQLSPAGTILVTLPADVRAFGVDLNSSGPFGVTVTYAAGGSFSHMATAGSGASGFFGVRTDSPITGLVLSTGVFTKAGLDNFEVGTEQVADTPEAVTLVAIGSGLIVMSWMRRRQRLLRLA